MKIYSKFKDYYDGIGYHSDYPTFIRKRINFEIFENSGEILSKSQRIFLLKMVSTIPRPRFSFKNAPNKYCPHQLSLTDISIIGFCGKLYPVYMIGNTSYTEPSEFIRNYFKTKKNIRLREQFFREFNFDADGIINWKKSFDNQRLEEIFITLNSPIFKLNNTTCRFTNNVAIIEINPKLSDISFQRIVDPYSAYQEIEMYLGNILIPKDLVGEFDDKLKLSAHGFDCCSFKNCNRVCS